MAITADITLSGATGDSTTTSSAGAARTRLPWPVIIYLLVVVFPLGINLGPLMMTSLRAFLIIMIIPLTINLFIGRYGKLYATDFLFVLHIAWATLALAINNPDQVVEQMGSVGIEFIGGYVVGRAYIQSKSDFVALCKLMVLIVFCLFPFTLFETVTARSIPLETIRKIPGVSSLAINNHEARLGFERVQMTFAHPIHWGLFCSVVFSLAFVALKGFSSMSWRIATTMIIGLSGFLALSSGALLALALQIGLIGWAIAFDKVKQRWWILFGLFVLAYITIDLLSNRSAIKVFMSYATFSAHTAYWRAIIFDWGVANVIGSTEKGIVGSPLIGIGLRDWIRPSFMNSGSMDNFWLVMAVRYGIPGFLTVTIGYILGVYYIMRRNFDDDPVLAQIRRAWVFTFLGLSFTLCTVHVWTNIYSFVFFMFGAGIWMIAAQVSKETNDTNTENNAAQPAQTSNPFQRPVNGATPYVSGSNTHSPTPTFRREVLPALDPKPVLHRRTRTEKTPVRYSRTPPKSSQ